MNLVPPPQTDLERQIFGGGEDSDLSDLSSDEAPQRDQQESEPESDAAQDDGAIPGDTDYVNPLGPKQQTIPNSGLPKIRKKKRPSADDGARPRKQRKKHVTMEQSPEPEVDLTPEEARRKALDDKLNALIKKPKPKKRRRGLDEEDLGQAAEEEQILQLKSDMLKAAGDDLDLNSRDKPAVAKLNMLSQVTAILQKTHLEGLALDQGILVALKEWLEPMPSAALPPLNVQRALFAILLNFKSIDTSLLKESYIGKVVMFYSRSPRIDQQIRRMADQLITNWMRPLLRRSATWRDKVVERADVSTSDRAAQEARARVQSQVPGMQDSATGRRHARIPHSVAATYKVAPRDKTFSDVASAGQKDMERFKTFSRQLRAGKAAARKV